MLSQFFKRTKNQSKNRDAQSEIQCPLCGKKFRVEDAMQCAACTLAQKCDLVMCPRCGYEFAK
jgi:uncharacterized C2H2 Zn-finger protein